MKCFPPFVEEGDMHHTRQSVSRSVPHGRYLPTAGQRRRKHALGIVFSGGELVQQSLPHRYLLTASWLTSPLALVAWAVELVGDPTY